MVKRAKVIMLFYFVIAVGLVLVGCGTKQEVKDKYDFTFNVNYEGGNNRVDSVPAGFKANYYQAKRNGFRLENWYENKDLTGEPFNFTLAINKDTVVYAKWSEIGDDIEVTFDYNYEKSPAPVVIIGEKGKNLGQASLPKHKRLGYEISGWYTDPVGGEKWDIEADILEKDITLYAKYEKMDVLKFDSEGKVILKNVEVEVSLAMGSWAGMRKGITQIIDQFNEEYAGQVYVSWTDAYTSEVARFEDPGFTNQYTQNSYRMGELLELLNIEFDRSKYYEAAIQENFIGDALMSYPVGHMVPSIMYNKKMLADVGETEPQTHEDFVRILTKVTEHNKNNKDFKAAMVYEGSEWQWYEMGISNIWANNDLLYYSYDSGSKEYVNSFLDVNNQEKASNAIKAYLELFKNPNILVSNSAGWAEKQGLYDVLEGNAFMAIVSYSRIYEDVLKKDNPDLYSLVELMPVTNLFNYGNIENAKTFAKGVALCLPNDTTANFDLEQLAGVALFAEFLSENGETLAYNDTVPASKVSHSSDDYLNAVSSQFKILHKIIDPSTITTLPGHLNEYYFFNYQSQAYFQNLGTMDYSYLENQGLIDAMIKIIADDISKVIKGD